VSDELLDPKTWAALRKELRGNGEKWWDEHRDTLLGVAKAELREVFEQLEKGKRVEAQLEIIASMDRETWRAYRDGTTAELRGVAARRADLLAAIKKLSFVAGKTVAKTVIGALQ